MIKVMFAIGTRPEGIKLAPVYLYCKKYPREVKPILVATSQHEELLQEVFKDFRIKPDFNLHIMKKNQTLYDITAAVLLKMENVLKEVNPQIVIFQGDTTTVLSVSLSAYYQKIDVGHVEAGLRSHNKYDPFPEEINRKLTTHIADINFAPTKLAAKNLLREGIDKRKIFITGNTSVDALFFILKRKWREKINIDNNKKLILVTAHRRESFGKGLKNIALALKEIGKIHDVEIVYPLHPNPNVQEVMRKILANSPNIHLLKPLNYIDFANLMRKSYLILTDSGGIQEEAPSLNIPVLVMRNVTERPEAIFAGRAKLVGTKKENIVKETQKLLRGGPSYQRMTKGKNPYGDGRAAERIVKILIDKYKAKL